MVVVNCPVCDQPVNAEAVHCPECGADPRLSRDEARRELVERTGRGFIDGDHRPETRRLSTGLRIGLACLLTFGLAIAWLGAWGLSVGFSNRNAYYESDTDPAVIGVLALFLCLPVGFGSLLACVLFFLSPRLRWLWLFAIGIPLLPVLALAVMAIGIQDRDGETVAVGMLMVALVLAVCPISFSLVGLRGRWRTAT